MALLNPDTLNSEYEKAHTAMRTLWEPLDEYERIARNRPHPKVVAAKLPTVTDGTLAGIIIAQPKRIVQRIPTGGIVSTDQPELAEIADFIWEHDILPNADTNGDVIQKSWIMLSKALTYGSSVSYTFVRYKDGRFGADFKPVYIKDVILERGKVYGPDCNVLYLRSWYTPLDIQQIIDKESKLTKNSKTRRDKQQYESPWDIPKLKQLLERAKPKDPDALTPAEREKSPDSKFIKLIHAFQTSVGSKFYTFSPDLEDGDNVVRTRVNRDPRGKLPLNFLYADIDLSNPLGRGHVELSGAMQNMIDSEMQSYQLMQKLMLNPPVMKWGSSIRGATVKYKPNAVWDMGNDQNSKLEVVDINNEAIKNFANNYGLMKSQILALTHNQETGTPAGNVGGTQSKTDAGVRQVNQVMSFDDNYLRKQYETWFEANAETMLNLHFAESTGQREVELTQDFIEDTMPQMQQQPEQVQIDAIKKQAIIDYDAIKTKLRFTVDPTSSKKDDDQTQLANLQTLISETGSNPFIYYYLLNDGYQLKLGEAYKDMFMRLGVEGVDKIVVKLPEDGDAQAEQLRGVLNPLYDKPKVDVPYIALPPSGQIQAAANAGITLSLEDVLGGPVLDPNLRGANANAIIPGVQNPIPNSNWRGQGTAPDPDLQQIPQGADLQAAQQQDMQPGQQTQATQPTDQVIPQGMNPNDPNAQPTHPTGVLPSLPTPHAGLKRNNVGGLIPAQQSAQPVSTPPSGQQTLLNAAPGPRLNPEDTELARQFLANGYSPQQTLHAVTLMHHGRNHDQIMQAIGQPQGGGK